MPRDRWRLKWEHHSGSTGCHLCYASDKRLDTAGFTAGWTYVASGGGLQVLFVMASGTA